MKIVTVFIGALLSSLKLIACTGLAIQTEKDVTINGRTVEFATPLEFNLAVIPRQFSFTGKTPVGEGLKYKAKYAATGVYCFNDVALMDGINEKGLVAAAFYFPGYASYSTVTSANQAKALSPVDFSNWILTQFATVDEVKEALSSVVIAPTVLPNWGDTPPPMHYIVYDKSGKSIVIEPINSTLKVHNNPLGVITNSPTFDWHMTNLNNYLNLSALNVPQKQLGTVSLESLGQGTGMLGLPGDFTPPSRFVRAAFFSTETTPVTSTNDAIARVFHLLNQFDIPKGAVAEKEQGATHYDYTLCTSVKNPEGLQYFYRSYDNQAIQFVDLNRFDLNAKTIKTLQIQGKQKFHDISSSLK